MYIVYALKRLWNKQSMYIFLTGFEELEQVRRSVGSHFGPLKAGWESSVQSRIVKNRDGWVGSNQSWNCGNRKN